MIRQASVHDISWFLDLDSMKRLDLNPPYQRRSVWTTNDRRFFLDTIFRNFPCPAIFIHKTIDETGIATYHIVDGKQRIETILKFHQNKIAISKDFGDERLNGKKFKELNSICKKLFWNYSLPVDFIDIPADLDVNEVFDRVNRNARNLERQELRHARFDGWFITECELEADDDQFWEDVKISTKGKAKRMKNVQFVSELLLILIEVKIVGFDQDYIDEKYAEYDNLEEKEDFDLEDYTSRKNHIKSFLQDMQAYNDCIIKYGKFAYNFYTLFGLIALNKIALTPIEMASRYETFMDLVDTFKNIEDPEEHYNAANEKPLNWDYAYNYYVNTKGANTDLLQREARMNALKDALLYV